MLKPPLIRVNEDYLLDGWRIDDAATHRSFAEDELAARFLGWTVEEARARPDSHYAAIVRRFKEDWAAGSRLSLAIRDASTGGAVGAIELRPIGDAVEVSYLVAPDFRGKGVAARALEAFLDWAAHELGVTRAVLNCHLDNIASQRVAEKCGFTCVSREGEDLRFMRQLAV